MIAPQKVTGWSFERSGERHDPPRDFDGHIRRDAILREEGCDTQLGRGVNGVYQAIDLVRPRANGLWQKNTPMLQGYFGQFLGDSEDGLLSITSHATSLGNLKGSLSTFSIACRFRLARNGFPVGGTDVPGGPFTVLIVREDRGRATRGRGCLLHSEADPAEQDRPRQRRHGCSLHARAERGCRCHVNSSVMIG